LLSITSISASDSEQQEEDAPEEAILSSKDNSGSESELNDVGNAVDLLQLIFFMVSGETL
jgi:hypothetical protein